MLLTIDIGNSNIVFGLPAGEGRARRLYRLGTVPERPVEEYFTLAASLFAREGVDLGRVDGAVICSVVPVLVPVLSQVVQRLTGITPYIVTSRSKSGLTLAIPEGDTLGNDILAADAAAAAEYPLPAIIFDMGTATTISVLDAQGAFRGGAILPGANLALSALAGGTALLPDIPLAVPEKAIGTDTLGCMQSGCVLGSALLLDGMIDRMESELGCRATVVATGGIAPVIAPACRHEMHMAADLILRGLAVLYEQNK